MYIVALTRMSPPQELRISHWSSREMAKHLKKAHGIGVSYTSSPSCGAKRDLKPPC